MFPWFSKRWNDQNDGQLDHMSAHFLASTVDLNNVPVFNYVSALSKHISLRGCDLHHNGLEMERGTKLVA